MGDALGTTSWSQHHYAAQEPCACREVHTDVASSCAYVPIVALLISSLAEEGLDRFKADVLWAIGRLGSLADAHIGEIEAGLTAALDDPDPQIRGTAVWRLGRVGRGTILKGRSGWLDDEGPLSLYQDGSLQPTTVGAQARRALAQAAANPA